MNNKLYAILTPGNSNNGFVDKMYTNNPITLVMDNIFDYKQVLETITGLKINIIKSDSNLFTVTILQYPFLLVDLSHQLPTNIKVIHE